MPFGDKPIRQEPARANDSMTNPLNGEELLHASRGADPHWELITTAYAVWPAFSADLAGLVASRRQPEIGAGARRVPEAGCIIECRRNRQGGYGADARCRHKQPGRRIALGCGEHLPVEYLDALEDRYPGLHERLYHEAHRGRGIELARNDLVARRAKPPAALPKSTPNVRSRPRISFSSFTRMRTSTSRAVRS